MTTQPTNPDALDYMLSGLFKIEHEYPAWYAVRSNRQQVEHMIELLINLMAGIAPGRGVRPASATTDPGALELMLDGLSRIEHDFPSWFAIEPLRKQVSDAIELVRCKIATSSRVDRPFAEGFFLLELDELLHHPSEN